MFFVINMKFILYVVESKFLHKSGKFSLQIVNSDDDVDY
jgi:hypothetical protein